MPDPRNRPRLQKALVLTALFGLALAAPLGLGLDRKGATARAALPDGPFSCGANDENRQPVKMWAGDMTSDGSLPNMMPCVSGVKMTLNIPERSGSASITGLRKLDAQSGVAIKTASGAPVSNVYHLGFKDFTIKSAAAGVTLKSPTTGLPYTLTLAPDHQATFGGAGVVTDLLVSGSSQIVIESMPAGLIGCSLLGGSYGGFLSGVCTVNVSEISASLVEFANAVGITTFSIKKMNLDIYYLVTHSATGGVPSAPALQLPNTTITVGGG